MEGLLREIYCFHNVFLFCKYFMAYILFYAFISNFVIRCKISIILRQNVIVSKNLRFSLIIVETCKCNFKLLMKVQVTLWWKYRMEDNDNEIWNDIIKQCITMYSTEKCLPIILVILTLLHHGPMNMQIQIRYFNIYHSNHSSPHCVLWHPSKK